MIIRTLQEIIGSEREINAENGNWTSRRFLLQKDGMGFSFHDTIIYANTRTLIHYKHHVESVYCIEGEGSIELIGKETVIPVTTGTMYALNKHEKHYLVAKTNMRIICVFNPPLTGTEVHREDGSYQSVESHTPVALAKPAPAPLKFAFLNLQEHPRGNFMLDCLIKAGLEPAIVIEETSSLAEKGRKNLSAELEKLSPKIPMPPPLAEVIGSRQIQHLEVANHNNLQCEETLANLKPDLIVLGDTRIIKRNIITLANIGVVNLHPGYLPEVKGNNPYIWAIIHDLPQGCTAHFIDEDVDTGPILTRRKIQLESGSSFPHLLQIINSVCGELVVESLHLIRAGMTKGIPQENFADSKQKHKTFTAAPSEIKDRAIKMLAQKYSKN
ncbi:MAG: ectoine synthase [Thermodesulfobacteriota bacterium]